MPDLADKKTKITREEEVSFVMSFVEWSDEMRKEFVDIWLETMNNYLVNPFGEGQAHDKNFPLSTSRRTYGQRQDSPHSGYSILKDSESHQIVETLLATTVLATMGQPGYIQSMRVGTEDVYKANTASRLLERDLGLEGHFRTMYQWDKDAFVFGTGIVELSWEFEQQLVEERVFELFAGQELSSFVPMVKTIRDDPMIQNTDLLKFYPDPGKPCMEKMLGCAKEFTITAREARAAARAGKYDAEAVERAIRRAATDSVPETEEAESGFEGLDRPHRRTSHPEFIPLVGIEYYGEVPWTPSKTEKDPRGDTWRRITVLGGEWVRSISWPFTNRRLPFYENTVNPMSTRFYGLAPLEVCRGSQDFVDTVLMNLADAVVKMTHPPWTVLRGAGVDLDAIRRYKPNAPIMMDRLDAASQLPFKAELGPAAGVMEAQKQSMRERSGATAIEQGIGFGATQVRSASEAAIRAQKSGTRPEMIATLKEREYLPPLGHGLLELNQRFLESSEDLKRRIGERPQSVSLPELMGDHDLRFVGSQQTRSNRDKINALTELASVVAQLPVAARFPWGPFLGELVKAHDLPELEVLLDQPQEVLLNTLLGQAARGGGSVAGNNGNTESRPPSGLAPAQVGGRALSA